MTIVIESDGAIWINGSLYCKSPEALEVSLKTLQDLGYTIDSRRDPESPSRQGRYKHVSVEDMEQYGWPLWTANLDDIRRGKCNSCSSYISTSGIQMHGHTCEVCGDVTYLDLTKDSTVNFTFLGDDRGWFRSRLQMTVRRWDFEHGWLYLVREVEEGSWGIMGPEEAEAYLAQHADKWEAVAEDGLQLVRLRYHLRHMGQPTNPETVIDVSDKWGHYRNFKIVKLWRGVEYAEHSLGNERFPVPEWVSIYEAWHWAPLEPSPTLYKKILSAVGKTSDAGYHYQDGRPAWSRSTYEEMGKYIRHLTTLDADAWDRLSPRFRLDGPGGITDVARFCHPDSVVENRPNIGNFLVGVSKIMDRQRLTAGEADAMKVAIDEDPDTRDFAESVVEEALRRYPK